VTAPLPPSGCGRFLPGLGVRCELDSHGVVIDHQADGRGPDGSEWVVTWKDPTQLEAALDRARRSLRIVRAE
jgi:hypothetical protein